MVVLYSKLQPKNNYSYCVFQLLPIYKFFESRNRP